jgi:hypothetical protein
VKDVCEFARKQKGKRIRDLAAWQKYYQAFLRITGSLLREGKIGENEYATYFWQGIPKALQNRIENRILTGDPIRDMSEPFGVNEIDLAVEQVQPNFSRYRFRRRGE